MYYRTFSDTGVPVGTTEQIRYGQNLFRYGTYQIQELIRYISTRRYYRTYSNTGVPLGTTELIRSGLNQIQEYP